MIVTKQKFEHVKLIKHQGNFFSIAGAPAGEGDDTYLELFFNFIDPTKANIEQDLLHPDDNDEITEEEEELPSGHEFWTPYQQLEFPGEYVYAGSPLIKYSVASTVESIPSTTGINGVNAPFQVLSDGQYIYIFRNSKSNQVYVDRFAFDNATKKFVNKKEVRFVRSQNKDIPLDEKDTLGSENLNGQAFIEPTTQLNFNIDVLDGNFTVSIIPNSEFKSQECWQIFVLEELAGQSVVNAYSISRSFDGLFDLSEGLTHRDDPRLTNKSNLTSSEAFNFKLEPYDRFSIKKDDQTLKGLKLPSSLLYHVQEQIVDLYGNRQFVKRGGRMLLSCIYPKTEKIDKIESTNGKIAFIDFEIGKNGVPSTVNPTGKLNNAIPINSISNSLGMALQFNGRAMVELKNKANFIPNRSSVSFWVNADEQETPTDQYLLSFTTKSTDGKDSRLTYRIELTKERNIKIRDSVSKKTLKNGTWNYISIVLVDNTSLENILYINGEAALKGKDFKSVFGYASNVILSSNLGTTASFYGQMTSLNFWDTCFSTSEIRSSMHNPDFQADKKVLDWPMNEGTGTITGNNIHVGVISGARWVSSNAPVVKDMPVVFSDENSLNIRSNILENLDIFKMKSELPGAALKETVYPNTNAPVNLLDSADGTIKCYFNQTDPTDSAATPRFNSLSFDSLVSRSVYQGKWETASGTTGDILFRSVTPTTDTNEYTAQRKMIVLQNTGKELCNVQFQLPESSSIVPKREVWKDVPRDITLLNQIINGNAIDTSYAKENPIEVENILKAHNVVIYNYVDNVTIGEEGDASLPVLKNKKSYASRLFSPELTDLPINGETANILEDSRVDIELIMLGFSNRWLKGPTPASISLGNENVFAPIESHLEIPDFPLKQDFTIESWIRPVKQSSKAEQTLLTYDNNQELAFQFGLNNDKKLFARRAGFPGFHFTKTENSKTSMYEKAVAQYSLDSIECGDWTHIAAAYQSTSGVNLKDKGFIDVPFSEDLNLTETFTIEGWARLQDEDNQLIAQRHDGSKNEKSWKLSSNIDEGFIISGAEFRSPKRIYHFDIVHSKAKTIRYSFRSKDKFEENKFDWAHLAVVFDSSQRKKPVIQKQHDEGQIRLTGEELQNSFAEFTIEMWLSIPDETSKYKGKKVLSRNITDEKSLSFDFNNAKDYTKATPKRKTLQITINGQVLTVDDYDLRTGELSHLAVVYKKNPVSNSEETKTATIIVYQDGINIKEASDFKGIMPDVENTNDWKLLGSTDKSTNSFRGQLGELRFWKIARDEQQIIDNMTNDLTGKESGLAGLFKFKETSFTGRSKGNVIVNIVDNKSITVGEKIKGDTFNVGNKVRFYVNGKLISAEIISSPIKESKANLWFGKESIDQVLQDFRIWKTPRTVGQINYYKDHLVENVKEQTDLVAWWRMNEGKGRLITDAKAGLEGIIKGGLYQETPELIKGLWVPTPFNVDFTFYVNGVQVPNEDDIKNEIWEAPDPLNKLIIGDQYSGRINELRVWETQRTPEQIKSSLFNSIGRTDDGLIAYYPFETGSGIQEPDMTRNGNDLDVHVLKPGNEWRWPTNDTESDELTSPMVPVSENHPVIVDLTNGVFTQESLDTHLVKNSSPSGFEIGNERALAFIAEGVESGTVDVNLITDFNVGEVEMLYVGQAQFDPSIIGYIEGAPPVPSENLSIEAAAPNKYQGSSSVKLSESETVNHTYNGSKERAFDTSIDGKVELVGEAKIGFLGPFNKSKHSIGVRTKIDFSLGWINEISTANTLTTTQKNQLDLTGSWVNNKFDVSGVKDTQPEKRYEQSDRVYMPNNMGQALVRSKTADVFAVRLKRTGATLGYQMIPNPDVAEDFNIITFKIDPTYVKNGSLDGYIGFDKLKDSGEKRSYFKPQEAFSLQRKIEREHQELQNYFDQYDSSKQGQNPFSNFSKINQAVQSQDEQKKRLARKSLVNTYVWTAEGGLFAEEVQFSASRTETVGGSYSYAQVAGLTTGFQATEGVAGAMFGGGFSLDALLGGHINKKITKSETDSIDFSIESIATGERFLKRNAPPLAKNKTLTFDKTSEFESTVKELDQGVLSTDLLALINDPNLLLSNDALTKIMVWGDRWRLIDEDTMFVLQNTNDETKNTLELTQVRNGRSPINFADSDLPGKVRSYRYKTFYLAPDKDNFTNIKSIVDPEWLDSADPDAVALNEALGNSNEVWRILHRVTFVSRVAPDEVNPFIQPENLADKTLIEPDGDSKVSNVSVVDKFSETDNNIMEFSTEMSNILENLASDESKFGTMDQHSTMVSIMNYAQALKMGDQVTEDKPDTEDE